METQKVYKVVVHDGYGGMFSICHFFNADEYVRQYRIGQKTLPVTGSLLYAFDTLANARTYINFCTIPPSKMRILECDANVAQGALPRLSGQITNKRIAEFWHLALQVKEKWRGFDGVASHGTVMCRWIRPKRIIQEKALQAKRDSEAAAAELKLYQKLKRKYG